MRAIRFDHTGGPDVLVLKDAPLPEPKPGEVRVRHTAIGVNFIDTYHRCGLYPVTLPSGLGLEAAGTIDAIGDGVSEWRLGDRVVYCSGPIGAYADANVVPKDRLVKIPDGISDEIAAAALLKGLTAQYLLKSTYPVRRGETILWHAAAGGVGLIAANWARHLGVHVIGTVGSPEKIQLAEQHGCEYVLNLESDPWVRRVRDITGGEGVPVVYDSIGKSTFAGSLDCLAIRGTMVSFGNASGAAPAVEPGLLSTKGSLYLTRPILAHYTRTRHELQERADDLFAAIKTGIVEVVVNQRFKLEDAGKAHAALHSRKTTGATVLFP